jgi:undecaprenyl-diphosphatase
MADLVLQPVVAEATGKPASRQHRRWFAAGVTCAGLAFVVLAVLAHRVPFFAIDLTITQRVQSVQVAWLDLALRPLNALGFPPLVGIIYGSIILLVLGAGAGWEAVVLGFATLGAASLNFLVKTLVARPRPPMSLVHVAHHLPGSGFPAGHVLNFTAFVGFLCYLAFVQLAPAWPRTALIAFLVALIGLMGIARIHAGEHWPSDVLGGYLLGILWLVTTVELYQWGRHRSRSPRLGCRSMDSVGPRTPATPN